MNSATIGTTTDLTTAASAATPASAISAMAQLAWDVYKSCREAPRGEYLKEIASDITALHVVLKEAEELLADSIEELGGPREKELQGLTESCRDVLMDLEFHLEKFQRASGGRNLANHLRWTQDDVDLLRARVNSNVTLLAAFNATIQTYAPLRLCLDPTDADEEGLALLVLAWKGSWIGSCPSSVRVSAKAR